MSINPTQLILQTILELASSSPDETGSVSEETQKQIDALAQIAQNPEQYPEFLRELQGLGGEQPQQMQMSTAFEKHHPRNAIGWFLSPKKKPLYEYSSVLANLNPADAMPLIAEGLRVAEEDLDVPGREEEPHITLLYGLHTDNPNLVAFLLQGQGPIRAKLGKVSLFPASETHAFDVLKVDVESEDLHRLHKLLCDNLQYTNAFDAYRPHLTLAYCRAGHGKKYTGKDFSYLPELFFEEVCFSSKDGTQTKIPLTGPPVSWLSLGAIWLSGGWEQYKRRDNTTGWKKRVGNSWRYFKGDKPPQGRPERKPNVNWQSLTDRAKAFLADDGPITADDVDQFTEDLLTLTVDEIKRVKKGLRLKASGNKTKLAQTIAQRALTVSERYQPRDDGKTDKGLTKQEEGSQGLANKLVNQKPQVDDLHEATASKLTSSSQKESDSQDTKNELWNMPKEEFVNHQKQLLKGTKIKDKDGRPLQVYHGTPSTFTSFNLDNFGQFDEGWLGEGLYFTDTESAANDYANPMGKDGKRKTGGRIIPVYLSAKNPLIIDFDTDQNVEWLQKRSEATAKDFSSLLKKSGYDGIVFLGPHYPKGGRDVQYFVLDPEQVVPSSHKELLERAIVSGEPVPPEVLKDYPDLAEKYAKQQPKAEEVKQEPEVQPPPAKQVDLAPMLQKSLSGLPDDHARAIASLVQKDHAAEPFIQQDEVDSVVNRHKETIEKDGFEKWSQERGIKVAKPQQAAELVKEKSAKQRKPKIPKVKEPTPEPKEQPKAKSSKEQPTPTDAPESGGKGSAHDTANNAISAATHFSPQLKGYKGKSLNDTLQVLADVDSDVFDPIVNHPELGPKAYDAGITNNEFLRSVAHVYDQIQSKTMKPAEASKRLQGTRQSMTRAIEGLRKIGKKAEADFYEKHGLGLLDAVHQEIQGK